jgi:hypothetical protein
LAPYTYYRGASAATKFEEGMFFARLAARSSVMGVVNVGESVDGSVPPEA